MRGLEGRVGIYPEEVGGWDGVCKPSPKARGVLGAGLLRAMNRCDGDSSVFLVLVAEVEVAGVVVKLVGAV
jgi:hypothetical protein